MASGKFCRNVWAQSVPPCCWRSARPWRPGATPPPSRGRRVVGRWDLTVHGAGGDSPPGSKCGAPATARWSAPSSAGSAAPGPSPAWSGTRAASASRCRRSGSTATTTWRSRASSKATNSAARRPTTTASASPGTGRRAPSLKREQPPRWGEPVELFNGKDLAGWKPRDADSQERLGRPGRPARQRRAGQRPGERAAVHRLQAARRVPLPQGEQQRHLPPRPLRGADRGQLRPGARQRQDRRRLRLPDPQRQRRQEARRVADAWTSPWSAGSVTVVLQRRAGHRPPDHPRHHRRRPGQRRRRRPARSCSRATTARSSSES